ncbi:hypothetical protein HK096_011270, partial [Nowakowskiella sp. JEL0078]
KMTNHDNQWEIFISYRRINGDFASNLYHRLSSKYLARGEIVKIFFDSEAIGLGTDFRISFSDAVANCQLFLPIVSSTVLASFQYASENKEDNVLLEWDVILFFFGVSLQLILCIIESLVQ